MAEAISFASDGITGGEIVVWEEDGFGGCVVVWFVWIYDFVKTVVRVVVT